ncbi:hypothetical protein QQF64_001133 [Cirrhinus molitorella]|uniref:Reverse transcriptase RNase H-like domain-containing protein n=1 Tax=Cirrhinus molitorella TaxID=172907 RepID=A0ABR3NZ60_9TELE
MPARMAWAFASLALTRTEQNYAQIEKECLSIVFACQRLLLSAPKCLQGMMLKLQNYNLNVVYKPGPEMYISDTLSRAALNTQVPNEPWLLQHAVSTVDSSKTVFSIIDQALHLNVTDASLRKTVNETKADNALYELAPILEERPVTDRRRKHCSDLI